MPGWKLTDLGTVPRYRHLPVIETRPVAINSQGEVVGSSTTPLIPGPVNGVVNVPERVFLWQRGKITDLGKASSDGINDRGEIVGSGLWPSGHALLWRHGKRIDLGTLGGRSSEAARIDDHGQVIGTSDLRESTPRSLHQHAFIWQNGKMTDLGTLGGANSRAIAINDHGQVIGVSDTAATGHHHGFLWQNGRMTDLGTLGGWTSDPVAINDHGQIVGQSTTRGGTVHALLGEAFLWQDGKMTDLGPLPSHPVCHHKLAVLCESIHTVATAINDRGQVVGYSAGAGDNEHAFLWEKGKMTDLGTLGGIWSTAADINDRGEIVGSSASAVDPFSEAFVWKSGRMVDLGMGAAISIDQTGKAIIGYREVGTLYRNGSFSTRGGFKALLWTVR